MVPVVRTREHLLAKPYSGAFCTGRFSLLHCWRGLCAQTMTLSPICRGDAAGWRVCLGAVDQYPRPDKISCGMCCGAVQHPIYPPKK